MTTWSKGLEERMALRQASFSGGSLDGQIQLVNKLATRYVHSTGERYMRHGAYVFIEEDSGEHHFERFHFKLADFLDEWDDSEAVVTDVDMTGREATVAKLMTERAELEASAAAGIGEDV